jgi:hypothetical protein
MTEDGRSAARLAHGRQHNSEEAIAEAEALVQLGTRFKVAGSTPVLRGGQLTVSRVFPATLGIVQRGKGSEDGNV